MTAEQKKCEQNELTLIDTADKFILMLDDKKINCITRYDLVNDASELGSIDLILHLHVKKKEIKISR